MNILVAFVTNMRYGWLYIKMKDDTFFQTHNDILLSDFRKSFKDIPDEVRKKVQKILPLTISSGAPLPYHLCLHRQGCHLVRRPEIKEQRSPQNRLDFLRPSEVTVVSMASRRLDCRPILF